jgi:protein SCO1/2
MCTRPVVASKRAPSFFAALVFGAVALSFTACKPKPAADADASTDATAADDGLHPLTGTVISVNAERSTLLVQHEDIPGLMPHMTMEFKVAPGDLAIARANMRIRAKVWQADDGFHLAQLWPDDGSTAGVVQEAARTLRQDTVSRGRSVYREVGENLPDFALYDQAGAVVQSARFRGKQLLINFIFTRCPDANMCPATVMKTTQLQSLAREAGVNNLELVSITLDPEFDTPGVLRDYAQAHGIDTSNYSFLTGPERAIKDLLQQLGVQAFKDGPLVSHTLATVLIDEKGKIIYRVDGSQWQPSDFASRLHRPEMEKAVGT